jgi:uncharacterized sporulation protein YeaH/YhbH (DUF444 family)
VASFVDRRLNPKGKSLANRQRFVRIVRAELKEAVGRSLKERGIGDLAKGAGEVVIPTKRILEPRFRFADKGSPRTYVLPGNKEFTEGDTLPRPPQGGGGSGREGSPDGSGEDSFQFTLSRDEYLDILFEDLELPDMVKEDLKKTVAVKYQRAGYSPVGSPSNIALVRTMRNSLARRISLKRPKPAEVEALAAEIEALEEKAKEDSATRARLDELRVLHARLARRLLTTPFLDPVDVRYNRFERIEKPSTQAVMFCLMDVSGSMTEEMKDLAKRFFLLLHLFLTRQYEDVDIVFIRHTSEAKEVDEETFFRSRETGGTVVSSALLEMRKIINERYPVDQWNIYAAQASDGDNYSEDTAECLRLLEEDILPLCQYFAYIEVRDAQEAPILSSGGASGLWRGYEQVAEERQNFAMKRVSRANEIFPVFHELFAKNRSTA